MAGGNSWRRLRLAEEQLAVEEAHRLVAAVGDVAEGLLDRRDRWIGPGRFLLRDGVWPLTWLRFPAIWLQFFASWLADRASI